MLCYTFQNGKLECESCCMDFGVASRARLFVLNVYFCVKILDNINSQRGGERHMNYLKTRFIPNLLP